MNFGFKVFLFQTLSWLKYDLFRAPAVLKPRQLNLKCVTQNVGHKLKCILQKKKKLVSVSDPEYEHITQMLLWGRFPLMSVEVSEAFQASDASSSPFESSLECSVLFENYNTSIQFNTASCYIQVIFLFFRPETLVSWTIFWYAAPIASRKIFCQLGWSPLDENDSQG